MARVYNLVIDQGTTFTRNVIASINATTTSTFDLTGFPVGQAQIRPSYSSSKVVGTFNVNTHTSNTSGIVNISMDAESTANIAAGTYVYDVLIHGWVAGGIGGMGDLNDLIALGNNFAGTTNTIIANTINYNEMSTAISTFENSNTEYTITNGVFANSRFSDNRPYYIAAANDVTISITLGGTFPYYIPHAPSGGDHSLEVLPSYSNPAHGFREVLFANVYPYGSNSAHVGNSHLVASGSQHPNAFFNNTYVDAHMSNSHPLWAIHFSSFGLPIKKNTRWIYSMYINPSHGGDGEGSPIRIQAYTANATHTPNTTSTLIHLNSNDSPFDTGSTGPHGGVVNLYASSPRDTRSWSRVSTVIDLRTQATPNTHPDWHKDTLTGNNHVENATNNPISLRARLHFRDQVDNRINAISYPSYSIMHDSHSSQNEIQHWRVGDEVFFDFVGGWKHLPHGGRTNFWGNGWSRQYRTIDSKNEAAPWIDLNVPGGAYGGNITLPRTDASNSTYDQEYFAQTVNTTLQKRNNDRFLGANTHDKMILSFSPYFNGYRFDEYFYIDGIQLEEQPDTAISAPRELLAVSLGGDPQTYQFPVAPVTIRIAEGTLTVTPSVTR